MHIIKYILFIVFWIFISAIFARYLMQFFSLFQNYFRFLLLEVYIPSAVSYSCIAIDIMYPLYIYFLSLCWLDFYMFHLTATPNNYIINILIHITWRKYKNISLGHLQKLLCHIVQIPFQLFSLILLHRRI